MGRVKELWQADIDRVGDDYFMGRLELEDAIISLKSLGLDQYEAKEYLAGVDEYGSKRSSPFTRASRKQGI